MLAFPYYMLIVVLINICNTQLLQYYKEASCNHFKVLSSLLNWSLLVHFCVLAIHCICLKMGCNESQFMACNNVK